MGNAPPFPCPQRSCPYPLHPRLVCPVKADNRWQDANPLASPKPDPPTHFRDAKLPQLLVRNDTLLSLGQLENRAVRRARHAAPKHATLTSQNEGISQLWETILRTPSRASSMPFPTQLAGSFWLSPHSLVRDLLCPLGNRPRGHHAYFAPDFEGVP
jgi:hypothetical protein